MAKMKCLLLLAGVLAVVSCKPASKESGTATKSAKPRLKLVADGFPAGHDSPEGVACDLVRAFIQRDASLFTNTCVRLYGGGKGPAAYAEFLLATEQSIRAEAERTESPRGPKSIGKVYAARALTQGGPASYGYAAFGFQEVKFVDVGVHLHDGNRTLNRTMVIKDRDGKWYVHPHPVASPLLSQGLNEESPSEGDVSDGYQVEK